MDEAVRALAAGLGRRVALVALGGYGRRELCPGSDVDLMVLHAERRADRVREAAERLFYPFWDAGLPLGHAVRTVAECVALARERLDAATAMLDARLIGGDEDLYRRYERDLRRTLGRDPAGFLAALGEANAARRAIHGSCSAMLEPDLKEGSGGLRDLHAIGWAGRVLLGSADAESAGEAGLLRGREVGALDDAAEFLVRLRSALHLETGRRSDRLFLDHQPGLAEAFGFEATVGLRAADALMRTLFEHARQVEHVTEAFFERAGDRASGAVALPMEVPPIAGPEQVLEAFAHMAESGARPSPAALDALEDAVPEPPPWTEEMRGALVRILGAGEGAARALEAMDRGGLLTRFLPEWAPVRCRPQRDPYHRFSVDVHLMRTVAGAGRILAGEAGDDPVLKEAAAAVGDREALLLGALLHDIGKTGEGRHVPVGVRVAEGVLERMGLPQATRDLVAFLVREHLLLSDTATRRDLSDENLILDVSARVEEPERLAMLYVLTVADAEATGAHASSEWRRALVRELVGKVQHVLERGEMGHDQAAALQERVAEVRGRLADEDSRAVDAYLERLPRAYLLAVPAETAAAHFRLLSSALATAEVRTEVRPRGEAYDLTVVAADRPGLLARIAGALALHGLNILSARAFTTEDGVALDLFSVEGVFDREVEEERWRRFRSDLRRALEGRISLEYRVREKRRHYRRPGQPVETRVTVDNDASDFFTVVEVSTGDRIGLLFDLARAFHELELDVHVAKVATYGGRVVDAFYVRDLYGRKLEDEESRREVERAIVARLAPAEA